MGIPNAPSYLRTAFPDAIPLETALVGPSVLSQASVLVVRLAAKDDGTACNAHPDGSLSCVLALPSWLSDDLSIPRVAFLAQKEVGCTFSLMLF